MTRPVTFTKASIRRAIEAARAAGLRVKEIKPDGTLVIEPKGTDNPQGQDAVEPGREIVF